MKTILLMTAILISAAQARAVVADKFKCDLSVSETGGESIQQSFEFDLSRVPRSASPSKDVRLTSASGHGAVQLDNKAGVIHAYFSLDYSHAVKFNSAGYSLAARQTTCFLLTADWCDHVPSPTDGSETASCATSVSACYQSNDPFDPRQGWTVVGLTPDGTALFDEKSLIPLTATFKDGQGQARGNTKVNCAYQGTYW